MKTSLAYALSTFLALSQFCNAEWEFFAMDTGTRDGQTRSYEQQAALVKELGFAGIGYTGAGRIPEMLAAVDKHEIKFHPVYNGIEVRDTGVTHNPNLEDAITRLSGRKAIVWLYVGGRRPADPTAPARRHDSAGALPCRISSAPRHRRPPPSRDRSRRRAHPK